MIELLLGGAALGSGILGSFNQAREARKALKFQREQYNNWQNARRLNEQNMTDGFNAHFDENGKVKGYGLLNNNKNLYNF